MRPVPILADVLRVRANDRDLIRTKGVMAGGACRSRAAHVEAASKAEHMVAPTSSPWQLQETPFQRRAVPTRPDTTWRLCAHVGDRGRFHRSPKAHMVKSQVARRCALDVNVLRGWRSSWLIWPGVSSP